MKIWGAAKLILSIVSRTCQHSMGIVVLKLPHRDSCSGESCVIGSAVLQWEHLDICHWREIDAPLPTHGSDARLWCLIYTGLTHCIFHEVGLLVHTHDRGLSNKLSRESYLTVFHSV